MRPYGVGGGRAQPSALLCRPLQRYWNVNVMQITAAGDGKRGRGRECGASTNFKSYSHAAEGAEGCCPLPIPRSYVNCRVIKIIIIMLNVIKFLI